MREEDSNWFSKWEEELPSQEELIPLSQSLITPDLASVFDIRGEGSGGGGGGGGGTTPVSLLHHLDSSSTEFGGGGGGGGGGGSVGGAGSGSEEPARTLKRPRLVWTPQLHKRFVDAVAHLGIKNAVPKTIMTLMSVDGLTRENVASHLQKYRLYLKRMKNINNGGGSGSGNGSGDSATDHLFASSPVPAHFLHSRTNGGSGGGGGGGGARVNPDHLMSYMPVALHHQQMVAGHQHIHGQYTQQHRQAGHIGLLPHVGGQFDHPFLARNAQLGPTRNGMLQSNSGFVEDVKVLTLFPAADE